ncbi:hypothetical protein GCM10011309_16700 [Litorimonas cladophorae]|uniref:Secreted protein n=1 Tax=Litorimonas cladophorae TaxID=1220491 RepID=A0A918NHJ6_9PROT|nr:hypothetical protein [Litorimonas cladophorae]GGX67705.1 hypothetical protein GCM10011309_16700 [Litorimonas cladophorae]
MRSLPTVLLPVFLTTSFCISVASWAGNEVPFDASSERSEHQIISIVAEKIFVARDQNFPPKRGSPEYDENIIHMDSRYQARYGVLKVVSGDFDAPVIDFEAYDHYGEPRFSKGDEAILVFIHDGPHGRVHSKYNFYSVYPTADGDWAACGDAYVQNDPKRKNKEPLEDISFLDPVEVNVPDFYVTLNDYVDEDDVVSDARKAEFQAEVVSENAEIDGLYQAPIWKRNGATATCLLGTRVVDLHAFQNETRFLPDQRDEICKIRHADELEGLDWQDKRVIVKACADVLKIQNLP